MIRLTCSDRDNKITLDFGKDFTDRDAIRDVLNRLQARGTSALAASSQAGTNGSSNGGSNGERGSPQINNTRAAPPAAPVSAEERARRSKLMQRKEVLKLHAKLVRGGVVTDEQFWHAMNYRYNAKGDKRARGTAADLDEDDEEAERQTKQGVPSDAFTSGTNCANDTSTWKTTVPTSAQRHLVFMEQPAVSRALAVKVPKEMTEEKFWEIFLQSSLAGRRRGSGPGGRLSKSETVATAEADAMFAPFQAAESEVEKRETAARVKGLARTLDLGRFDDHRTAHVLEGHVVGGDAPRSMKRQRGGGMPVSTELKLLQMVNRHGTLIVDEGAKDGPNWTEEEERKGRPLEDLEVDEEASFAKLGVTGLSQAVGGAVKSVAAMEDDTAETVARAVGREMEMWNIDVRRMQYSVPGSANVLASLLATMRP